MTSASETSANAVPVNDGRLPRRELLTYSVGQIAGTYLWTINMLTNPIFNMELHVRLTWLGIVLGANRILDAITDLLIGYWSDRVVTRWGRRRPLILVGGLFCALCYAAMWMFPRDLSEMGYLLWYGLISVAFYIGTTLFGTGYWALGVELTSDYHERTRVSAWRSYVSAVAGLTTPWFLWVIHNKRWFADPITGIRWLGGTVALLIALTSVPVAVFCKERYARLQAQQRRHISFARAFTVMFSNREFLRMTGVGLLMMASLTWFEQFSYYINFFYVFGGNKEAATKVGAVCGNIGTLCGLAGIPLVQYISRRLGKHMAVRLALMWMILGSAIKWWCYVPAYPWLQTIVPLFYSIGISAFFTIVPSMTADIIDTDELMTGERREAMFSAVGNLVNKIASAGAAAATGFIMNLTGFVVEKNGDQTPATFLRMRFMYSFASAVVLAAALALVWRYSLTHARMREIQADLARLRERRLSEKAE